jgi:hypothetical protein
MFEEGKADEAEAEKQRLEQKQRETRKIMEAAGKQWVPRWFEPVKDSNTETGQAWVYKGGYWESRGRFQPVPDIF